jgi:DNA helicase-2/ATP-dependent DNA helicase PcrA
LSEAATRLSPPELVSQLEKVTGKKYSIDQKTAIVHKNGPLWITAGPGSGKTEVLVARTIKLLACDGVRPGSILLTTFTERAARSLLDRVTAYLSDLGMSNFEATEIRTGTLHSLCNTIMRDHRYGPYLDLELLDENQKLFFVYAQAEIIEHFQKNWEKYKHLFPGARVSKKWGPGKWAATQFASDLFDRITEFRVNVQAMSNSEDETAQHLAKTYQVFRKRLYERWRCDFSTLQEYFLQFLDSPSGGEFLNGNEKSKIPPIKHILVDEFQDTNPIQEDIYFKMAKKTTGNLVVVGDDDQALYRFRGGTVDSLVNFGARCESELGVAPFSVNLNENLRSHPGIVQWFNKYITFQEVLKTKGVRASGKREMVPKSNVTGKYPAVCAILGDDVKEAALKLANFVESLYKNGFVTDWRDIGLLFRSTRESSWNAGPYVKAIRAKGIPVYNPRSRALHEDQAIQRLLGTLLATLDPGFDNFNAIRNRRVVAIVQKWISEYKSLAESSEGKEIAEYVKNSHNKIGRLPLGETLNITVMDVLYRVLSLEPFRSLKEDPNYGTRFAQITTLLDSFASLTDQYGVLRGSTQKLGRISWKFLNNLYNEFSGFIEEYGLNEPEDPDQIMPPGYVQVMTVHQAKGLEFPVVVVENLNDKPEVGSDNVIEEFLGKWSPRKPIGTPLDRAGQDLVRRFYVAYSRPKNLLVLCGVRGSTSSWSLGEWNGR